MFLEGAGSRLLRRFPVIGQAVGDQKIDHRLLVSTASISWSCTKRLARPRISRKGVSVVPAIVRPSYRDAVAFLPTVITAKAEAIATSVSRAPGFLRRKIGGIIVTALNDGFNMLPWRMGG
jgi:hypothetical protein